MKPIPSLPGYFADADGDIVNAYGIALVRRESPTGPEVRPKTNGKTHVLKIIHLVAEAYHGPPPPGHTPHALDGDLDHVAPANLEYRKGPQYWPTPEGFTEIPGYLGRYALGLLEGVVEVYDKRSQRFLCQDKRNRVSLVTETGARHNIVTATLARTTLWEREAG